MLSYYFSIKKVDIVNIQIVTNILLHPTCSATVHVPKYEHAALPSHYIESYNNIYWLCYRISWSEVCGHFY